MGAQDLPGKLYVMFPNRGTNEWAKSRVCLVNIKQMIRTFHNVKFQRKQKYLERFLNSCQEAKIGFGLSNFIQKQTLLIFQ